MVKKLIKKFKNNKFLLYITVGIFAFIAISIPFIMNFKPSKLSARVPLNTDGDRIHFINTGNSDMMVIESNGEYALIDGGFEETARSVSQVGHYFADLLDYPNKKLKYVISTHNHVDHAGGLVYLTSVGRNHKGWFIDKDTEFYLGKITDSIDESAITRDIEKENFAGYILNHIDDVGGKNYLVANNRRYKLRKDGTWTYHFYPESTYDKELSDLVVGNFKIKLINTEDDKNSIYIPGGTAGHGGIMEPYAKEANRNSLVALVTHSNGSTALLTGDMEVDDEYRFLCTKKTTPSYTYETYYASPNTSQCHYIYEKSDYGVKKTELFDYLGSNGVDIYKMGHHGSYTSNSVDFMELLHPKTVFVTRPGGLLSYNDIPYGAVDAITYLIDRGSDIYSTGYELKQEDITYDYENKVYGQGEAIVVEFDRDNPKTYTVRSSSEDIDINESARVNNYYSCDRYDGISEFQNCIFANPVNNVSTPIKVYRKNNEYKRRWVNTDKGYYYYYDRNVILTKTGFQVMNDKKLYYFTSDGIMQTKISDDDDTSYNKKHKYTFNSNGAVTSEGWAITTSGEWVYTSQGKLYSGWKYSGGEWYYMSSNVGDPFLQGDYTYGKMIYYNPDVNPYNSVADNKVIYPVPNEVAVSCKNTDKKDKNGKYYQKPITETQYRIYMFDKDGLMKTGTINKDGEEYYFRPNGELVPTSGDFVNIKLNNYTVFGTKDAIYKCNSNGFCIMNPKDGQSISPGVTCYEDPSTLAYNDSEIIDDSYTKVVNSTAKMLTAPSPDIDDEEEFNNSYEIKYNCGIDGEGTPPSSQRVKKGDIYIAPDVPGTCHKDGYVFGGFVDPIGINWSNKTITWNFKNGEYGIDYDTLELSALWNEKTSTFKTGSEVNSIIKNLPGTDNGNAITKIERYEEEPSIRELNAEIVSLDECEEPIYMWFDNGTLYWWSNVRILYLNQDSSQMFKGLNSVTSIDIFGFNTEYVTNMDEMFSSCGALTTIYASDEFDTSNSTSHYSNMFKDDTSLVGGAGTTYSVTDGTYAHIDGGSDDPGYFTIGEDYLSTIIFNDQTLSSGVSGEIYVSNPFEPAQNCKDECVYRIKSGAPSYVGIDNANRTITFENNTPKGVYNVVVTAYDDNKNMKDATMTIIIGDGTPNITGIPNEKEVEIGPLVQMPIYANARGTFTVTNSDNSIASVSLSNTNEVGANYKIYLNIRGLNAGNSNITVTFTPSDIENFSDITVTKTINLTVKEPSSTVATFKTGKEVNAIMKSLTSGENLKYYVQDSSIKHIKRSSSLPDLSSVLYNTVSTDESRYPIYMWYYDSTIYWYSEEDNVFLNENSSYLFSGLNALTSIELSDFNTYKVTDMKAMFHSCTSLTNIDLSTFFTGSVTDMSLMFYNCLSLKAIDLNSFITSNVTRMRHMFSYVNSVESIDLSMFDTSNVVDMGWMFSNNPTLISLNLSSFDTSKVTDMSGMFYECKNLRTVNLTSFNTSEVTDMSNMFDGCEKLDMLDLSSFNTNHVGNMNSMFMGMSSLRTIYVGNSFNVSNVEDDENMFEGCTNIEGEKGTTYNKDNTSSDYAKADQGDSSPGYFTLKLVSSPSYDIEGIDIINDEFAIFKINKEKLIELAENENLTILLNNKELNNDSIIKTGDIINIEGFEYKVTVLGDVNGDGIVDVGDLSSAYRIYKNNRDGTPVQRFAADINQDENVDISDLSSIYNIYKGD